MGNATTHSDHSSLSIESSLASDDVLQAPRRRQKSRLTLQESFTAGVVMDEDSGSNSSGDDVPIDRASYSEDPHAHGMGGDLTSAVLGIIKGMVGPAILYLPHGFATAGYGMALPTLVITTAMFLYSSQCLLLAWKVETMRDQTNSMNTGISSVSNSCNSLSKMEDGGGLDDSGDTALLGSGISTSKSSPSSSSGVRRKWRPLNQQPEHHHHQQQQQLPPLSYPELANRALGPRGELIVKTGIALMQSGVCLTYLIFVPHNLHTSMNYLFHIDLSPQFYLIVMILIQIPLSWIRDISKLTCTNFMANCLILYGLMLCLGFAFEEATKNHHSDTPREGPGMGDAEAVLSPLASIWDRITHLEAFEDQWFLFIGTSVLLFEGSITLLVPLQESVIVEEQRRQFPIVYQRVILSIIAFYIFFGISCWASFGKDVHTVLTTSLPPGIMATSVQVAYSIAVILTFPLQNFPALEIATKSIAYSLYKYAGIKKDSLLLKRSVLATWLVLGLAIVGATMMNSLDKVVSLMGSLLGCPIAFVIPPLIHTQLARETLTEPRKRLNQAVALGGTVAMILASIATLVAW